MEQHLRQPAIGYVVAVLATAAVVLLHLALAGWLGEDAPLMLFVMAVMAAAWHGGLKPGLLATALSATADVYLFLQPPNFFSNQDNGDRMRVIIFVAVGVLVSALSEALHAARRRAERYAQDALDKQRRLEEADRHKNEFLAMLAHELRNPLAAVCNAVTVLRMKGLNEGLTQSSREIIERQVVLLTRLVDDLSDLTRISRGKIRLQSQPLEMAEVVNQAVESSRPLFEASKHRLEVTLPKEPLWVSGDPTRLAQVVLNLLNNSAKYTQEGGHIWLTVENDDGEVVVRVRDNGMGIPAESLPKVFDLFTQSDSTLHRSKGGLGIGLSLVRRLVELHGGTVEAFSDGTGQGSEFIVRLPQAVKEWTASEGRQQTALPHR